MKSPWQTTVEKTTYYIRGTDPPDNQQVIFECVGFEMAHEKAAELRMAAYKQCQSLTQATNQPPKV